jgi:hypothetical protein
LSFFGRGHSKSVFEPPEGKGTIAKINIDELSEAELVDLNHRIVERPRS